MFTVARCLAAGTIRLTATENAAEAVLWPALRGLLPDYPDIKVEVVIDYAVHNSRNTQQKLSAEKTAFFRCESPLP